MEEKGTYIEKYIDEITKSAIPENMPCIPTRTKGLLFPNTVLPMFIGRDKSLLALEKSLEAFNSYIFVTSQKVLENENPSIEEIYHTGTVGRVVQISKTPNGEYKILLEGIKRGRIKKVIDDKSFFLFDIEILEDKFKKTKKLEALVRKVKALFQKYMELTKKFPPEAILAIDETSEPDVISDLVASVLPIELEEKQGLIESYQTQKRLEDELEILTREIELLELEENLESKVKEKIEKTQKEFYLREKLKTIQQELDGGTDEEISELKQMLLNKEYPKFVKEKAEKEIEKLSKMSPYSPESTVVRNYLDWILNMPWNTETKDSIDIRMAKKILDSNHYGLSEPKERIIEFLAVKKLSDLARTPILCFVGAPGVGKTTLGKSIADSLGRKFGRISLGGCRDEAEIKGHRKTYVGAMPGRIIQTIRKLEVNNPVIVLDEIDKMGISYQGDPAAALLEVLDPGQNATFSDNYLEIPFDLSKVIFVATANVVHTIPPALLDRMELLEIAGYTDFEKYNIAKNHIIKNVLPQNGLKAEDVQLTPNALKTLISMYTREAGVRDLERTISRLMRKVAVKYVKNRKKVVVKEEELKEYLGTPPFFESEKNGRSESGLVTGLAWTAYGGSILNVEALTFPGKGNLILTGKLGEVMQESAKISLSLCRRILSTTNIVDEKYFEKNDFHIHLPEGAVPKDGPSAGVTLTTALVSAISNKKVRNDIAMTGEISLRGKVLAVGGIKEKLLSAYRAGIYEILLPFSNQKDVEKLPPEVIKRMKLHFVHDIEQVLEIALIGGIKDAGKEG
ncbi:MAG TPA: endopeptidase La [Petrotogaceae bacterium]|nr:endopeptidase La [Petrotogaceae bacterium]HQF32414.1 endopeptidase La [Petrotogaceae bacterium]